MLGNPLAVVLDAEGLTGTQMQQFAAWTHLSETTFVLPPTPEAAAQGADYRVRIFTPGGELPFAGHPTLGTCHAWLEHGGRPHDAQRFVQECPAGLVPIRRQGAQLAFAAPAVMRTPVEPALLAQIASALGLETGHVVATQHLDNGPKWLGILLDDRDTLLQLEPDHQALKNLGHKVGLAYIEPASAAPFLIARSSREARAFGARKDPAFAQELADDFDMEVRAFAAPLGVNEDPVTGSLNAALAQWLIADGFAPPHYVAAQGTCLGRQGRVTITQEADGQVWVGGTSSTVISGIVQL